MSANVKKPPGEGEVEAISALTVRPSAVGTNDWLDEIAEILNLVTHMNHERMDAKPELKPYLMEQQLHLLQLTVHVRTLRYDVASGQPPGAPPRGPVDKGGGAVDDGPMSDRIAALEKDMAAVKTDVAVIRSNYATREDLHKEMHSMTWKVIGAAALLTGAVFFIVKAGADTHPQTQQVQQAQTSAPAPQPSAPPKK